MTFGDKGRRGVDTFLNLAAIICEQSLGKKRNKIIYGNQNYGDKVKISDWLSHQSSVRELIC